MKLSEKLQMVAEWLKSTENDLLISAEQDDKCLIVMAQALVNAADALQEGAEEIAKVEPIEQPMTPQKLDEIAALASAFDESGDELLMKQAGVLDEILLTLAAPKNAKLAAAKVEEEKIDQIKKKYKDTLEHQHEMNHISEAVKDVEKSPKMKEYRPQEFSLSTRYCPDHFGTPIARIGENFYQCVLDHKVYNFETGYTTLSGNKVPGGSVSEQGKGFQSDQGALIFDTRSSKLGLNQ